MNEPLVLTLLFFTIALLYAAAGFGGGSSYLAVLALAGVAIPTMRPIALLCNLAVVSGNLLVFRKKGLFDLQKTWPLAAVSVPLAFLGGWWPVKETIFMLLLGISLVAAGILLLIGRTFVSPGLSEQEQKNKPTGKAALLLSGGIGFLSGLVGIGGGIFLSPVLHLMHWDTPKRIAAAASFFILVNSMAGLGGQLTRDANVDWRLAAPLLLAVILGGQIGSRLSANWLPQAGVRYVTALLVLYAGINILWKNL